MIRYDLMCDQGHAFDGWFRDSAAFDTQLVEGMVQCADCGSTKIEKQLMAPGIPAKANSRSEAPQRMANGLVDPRAQMLMQMMREFRAHIEQNAENVGRGFAEEARKIHYGESEKRGIYGEATREEAHELVDEGIEVHPLPRLPEDGN